MGIDPWFEQNLYCPVDLAKVYCPTEKSSLVCSRGHTYPVVDGIPCMLRPDAVPTHKEVFEETLAEMRSQSNRSDDRISGENRIDPYVQKAVRFSNGYLIKKELKRYPIPTLELPPGNGSLLLDIGCNWGRWSIAAARLGYRVVGIEPSLEAVKAARRVARSFGLDNRYIVGDARYLPFPESLFDFVFSFATLQCFSKKDLDAALYEIKRVLAAGGECKIQMRNKHGVVSMLHYVAGRASDDPAHWEAYYWTIEELKNAFEEKIGPARVNPAGYLTAVTQLSDADLVSFRYRPAVFASAALQKMSEFIPPLTRIADGVYVTARKPMATSVT